MSRADLHLHSNHSDGKLSPTEVMQWAAHQKIKAVALTDHMAIGGIGEAQKIAQKHNMNFMPGIELNTKLGLKHLHILGYGMDLADKDFLHALSYWQKIQTKRMVKTIDRLIDLKFDISFEEVLKMEAEYLDLYHLYEILTKKEKNRKKISKEVSPRVDLFETINGYFGRGRPARITKFKQFNTIDALRIIRNAGGITVLAHPGMNLRYENDEIIARLKKEGLKGVEAISGHHTWDQIVHYQHLAVHNRLLITGGSDFHARVELDGFTLDSPLKYYGIPYKVYSDLRKRIHY